MAKKASTLEDFLKFNKTATGIGKVFQGYQRETQEVAQAQELIEPIRETIPDFPAINYADRVGSTQAIEAILSLQNDKANGYLKEHAKEIVQELPDKKLISNYLFIEPRKTKDKAHDDIAKLHEEVIRYETTMQRARKGELTEKEIKKLQKDVEERVKKSIDPKTNKDNKYISSDTKKKLLAVIKSGFENQPDQTALYYTAKSLQRVKTELDKKFSDDKQRLKYVRANLTAIALSEQDRARDYISGINEGAEEGDLYQIREGYNQLREAEKKSKKKAA